MKLRSSLIVLSIVALGALAATERAEQTIQKQIEQIKDSDTGAWRKVPWTASLLEARRASEREKQPLFLFTHDGNIETGRC
jgi:hypothetical protein